MIHKEAKNSSVEEFWQTPPFVERAGLIKSQNSLLD